MYTVLVDGKFPKNATMNLPFWYYNQKNINSIAVIKGGSDICKHAMVCVRASHALPRSFMCPITKLYILQRKYDSRVCAISELRVFLHFLILQ